MRVRSRCRRCRKPGERPRRHRRQTIGLRTAMTKLQAHCQDRGLLDRGAVLPHRQGVDRLAYLRDEVVHKALRVGVSDIEVPLDVARRFVSSVALQVLGRDLLQG